MHLTFDAEHADHPADPRNAERILDMVRGLGVTFFVQGRWASGNPKLVERMFDEGHRVGSHSHYHTNMPLLTKQGMDTDLNLAEHAIYKASGRWPDKIFRPPFGSYSVLLDKSLKEHGYETVMWTVPSLDWSHGADEVERRIRDAGPDDVVLCHTWPDSTVEALGRLLVSV